MGRELWHVQNQNRVNVDFKVKFDFEGLGQLTWKIGILVKVFCIFFYILVVLDRNDYEFSRGQLVLDAEMDGRTDRCRQLQYPKAKTGKNFLRSYDEKESDIESVPVLKNAFNNPNRYKCMTHKVPQWYF